MSYFRSEDIDYYKLVIPREIVWEIIDRIGKNIIKDRTD
jgi:hypothetical protein